MSDYQIKIEPFEYVALQDIRIHKGINCHADAELVLRIKDGRREAYLSMLLIFSILTMSGCELRNLEGKVVRFLYWGFVLMQF